MAIDQDLSQGGVVGRDRDLPPFTGVLRPLVDGLAGVNVGVQAKLFTAFLVSAVLLLGMAILGIVVLQRMNSQMHELSRLQEQTDISRQMGALVTGQSHFRAMALLTGDDGNNVKITTAKAAYLGHLDTVEAMSGGDNSAFFSDLREATARYDASSAATLVLYEAGDIEAALALHLEEEHPISHELEAASKILVAESEAAMAEQVAAFGSDRQLLTIMLFGFSGASLLTALLLGFVVSWSLIGPVRRIDSVVARIAGGDFKHRVDVRNRDEFGRLGQGVNTMALRLADSYSSLETEKQVSETAADALQNELDKGRQLQRDFLPAQLHQPEGWELAAFLSPARDVSGDFYDAFTLPGGKIGLVLADVCDKGVGSALFMALSRSLMRVFSGQIHLDRQGDEGAGLSLDALNQNGQSFSSQSDALDAVGYTNNYIANTHGDTNMFATLFFAVLDPATGVLRYINAGHESPAILGRDGIKARLHVSGPAVGVVPNATFDVREVQLDSGDFLVSYTDGITDARNPNGESLTEDRLMDLLATHHTSAQGLLDQVESNVRNHMGTADQFDDISLLIVRRQ